MRQSKGLHLLVLGLWILSVLFKPTAILAKTYDLEEVMNRALQKEESLDIQRSKIRTMRRRVSDSIRNYFPDVSLSWSQDSAKPNTLESTSQVSLVQPLWTGGRLGGVLQQNRAGLRSAKMQYQNQARGVLSDAINSYFNLLKYQSTVETQENLLSRSREALRLMKKQYRIGQATELELMDVKTRINSVQLDYKNAKNQFQSAKLRFNRLLERDLEATITARNGDFEVSYDTPSEITQKQIDQGIKKMLQRSYRLKRLRSEKRYYKQGVQLARANYLPSFNFRSQYTSEGESAFTQTRDSYYVGVDMKMFLFGHSLQTSHRDYGINRTQSEVNLTFFDNSPDIITTPIDSRRSVKNTGSLDVQTQQAEQRYQRALVKLNKTREKLKERLREMYFDLEENRLKVVNTIHKDQYRKEKLEVVRRQRKLGKATVLDLLGAVIAKANSRRNLIEAWYAYYRQQLHIDLLIGETRVRFFPND
jgi:outer membrane protein TolC